MLDYRKIEAFCKVCELRSFSKAGEALFLSQPTVSAHIQVLEREFDVRLLDRMGRTVLPTPAGLVLYRYAKKAFAHLETAKAEIRALLHEVTGELILGSSNIPAHHVLPDVLAAFSQAHPQVKPSLMVTSSAAVTGMVRNGDIMAGIVGSVTQGDPDILDVPLLESEIIVIAPPSLADLPCIQENNEACRPGTPVIGFETAASLNWIVREESSTTRKLFESALLRTGYDVRKLRPGLCVDSAHACLQYVRAGLGVSATVRIAAQDALARGEIIAFTIEGVHAARRFFHIINAKRQSFPAAGVFLDFLQNCTADLRPFSDCDSE